METKKNKISPEIIIRETSSIVMKAAEILEDNIADGIAMAQDIEKKYFEVGELRNDKEIVNKFRKDSHKSIDILFDAFSYMVKTVNEIVPATKANIQSDKTIQLPILETKSPISSGNNVTIPIFLENESLKEAMKVELTDNGLKSASNEIIKKNNITYNPKCLILEPKQKGKIDVMVYVPKQCKKGNYEGIIRDKNRPDLQALIRIDVE